MSEIILGTISLKSWSEEKVRSSKKVVKMILLLFANAFNLFAVFKKIRFAITGELGAP